LLACIAAAATCDLSRGMSATVSCGAGVLGVPELDLAAPKLRQTPSPSNSAELGSVQQVLAEIAEAEVKVSEAHETPEPQGPLDADLVPVLFSLRIATVEDVVVVGSWTGWKGHFKLIKHVDDVFQGWVDVPVGTHQFKFITDGHWITSDSFPIEVDEAGNSNNILSVPATPRSQSPAAVGGNDMMTVTESLDERLGAVDRHSQPAVLAPANGGTKPGQGPIRFALRVLAPIRLALRVLLFPFCAVMRLMGLI